MPTLQVPPFQLTGGNQFVRGWYSGTATDYERMMSGKARFRVLLKM